MRLIDRQTCTAILVTCSDFRFKTAERALAEALGLADDYDLIARPGGIRSLVQPRSAAARDTLADELRLLRDLHQFTRIIAVNHVSCRAYDDIATGANERAVHAEHLRRAKAELEALLPGVTAELYLADAVRGASRIAPVAD
jgi:hypothetical protein